MHMVALATMCVVVVGVSRQTLPAPRRLRTEFQPPDEIALSVPTDGLRLSWQVSEQPHLCVCGMLAIALACVALGDTFGRMHAACLGCMH